MHAGTVVPLRSFCAEFAQGVAVDEDHGKIGVEFMERVLEPEKAPQYFMGGC